LTSAIRNAAFHAERLDLGFPVGPLLGTRVAIADIGQLAPFQKGSNLENGWVERIVLRCSRNGDHKRLRLKVEILFDAGRIPEYLQR
jgi:hypothetical protein